MQLAKFTTENARNQRKTLRKYLIMSHKGKFWTLRFVTETKYAITPNEGAHSTVQWAKIYLKKKSGPKPKVKRVPLNNGSKCPWIKIVTQPF